MNKPVAEGQFSSVCWPKVIPPPIKPDSVLTLSIYKYLSTFFQ